MILFKEKKKFRKDELLPLFISIVIAVGLWVAIVSQQRNIRERFTVPLEVRNIPSGLVIKNDIIGEINLTLTGPPDRIAMVRAENLKVFVDLCEGVPGTNEVAIIYDIEHLPPAVRLVKKPLKQITIDLDKYTTRVVEIRPLLVGTPLYNFEIEEIIVQPQFITIGGPAAVLEGLDYIYTQTNDLEGLQGEINKPVEMQLPGSVSPLTNHPVQVYIHISDVTRFIVLENIPVNVLLPGGYELRGTSEPEVVRVRLNGTGGVSENVGSSDVYVSAMLQFEQAPDTAGEYTMTLPLTAVLTVSDVVVRRIEPEETTVTFYYRGEQ